jgi:hypothetical protein
VDMHNPRGTQMGLLENIQGQKILPMDNEKFIEKIEQNEFDPQTPQKPLTPAEQREFLSKLNLDFVNYWEKSYEVLLQILAIKCTSSDTIPLH